MLVNLRALIALSALIACPAIVCAQEVPGCGSLQNAFGPFDYRDPTARGEPLHLVESAHFTPEVEGLRAGHTGTVIADLDYTLRAFPNHHRALNSLAQYAIRGGKVLSETIPSADCYFQRAITFAPNDEVVRAVYGNFLFKSKMLPAAKVQYEEALRMAPTSAEINYNAGLFFVATGDLTRAKQLAKVAYDQGYPLTGLKTRIEAAESPVAKKASPAATR